MQLTTWRTPLTRNSRACSPFDELDQMFASVFGAPAGEPAALATPVDVSETEDAFRFRVELPGVDPKDVEVTLHEGLLTISGEKRDDLQPEGEGRRMNERRFGAFRRQFRLSTPVDEQQVAAEHKHGVLLIELKKQAAARPRRIEIRAL